MQKFGIYANAKRDPGLQATKSVIRLLEEAGYPVYFDSDTAQALGLRDFMDAKSATILFILGGDGTILRAARKYVKYGIKLIGINTGHLGFMSELNLDDVSLMMEHIRENDYVIDERMMLEARMNKSDPPVLALNDFVITKINRTRMVKLDLFVNGAQAELYNGDGLIVSTPTGSTAYSLSAGGPIIAPNVNCVLVTPICPHSLYARSIVAKYSDTITVRPCSGQNEIAVSADGQEILPLDPGEKVTISRSALSAQFLRMSANTFFPQLKDKLAQWSVNKK
ncbi:MAG: NAD(+)/NADH kinase [Christensenella sp.]|nr:NAD(+)/NADH kinase [Christensenella sp.]